MNSFGRIFKVSVFGESHGYSVGVLIDGVPAGLPLAEADFEKDIERRRSGIKGTTPRKEADRIKILSGVFNDKTTGAPMLLLFENTNIRSSDYLNLIDTPRPGHADFTASVKFGGFNDFRGSGHFSGRLTLGLVAAGVIAKKILKTFEFNAYLKEAGGIIDIEKAVDNAMKECDSIGGIVECRISGVPAGLGEPFFDSVESLISHIIFAIPAVKGIEFGSGFAAAKMKGSLHNDRIISLNGKTDTNNSGGINGGISNGNEIVFRIVVKPASSISISQKTFNMKTKEITDLKIEGRHDTCIALRFPVIAEAAAAIVLVDLMMLENKIDRIIT